MQETCVDDRVDEGCCAPTATIDLGESVALQCVLVNNSCRPDDSEKEEECLKPATTCPTKMQPKAGTDR